MTFSIKLKFRIDSNNMCEYHHKYTVIPICALAVFYNMFLNMLKFQPIYSFIYVYL